MSRLIALAIVLLGTLVATPSPVRADASIAFVINDRSPAVPTARVRWSFALGAAPSPATSVTIDGVAATLDAGVFAPLPSGDRFRLDSAPAFTNGVTLLYEVRSHFNGSDFCTLKAGTVLPKTVNVSFTGPQITQHSIVTYTVAGTTALTTTYCQLARRRVNNATVSVSVAPPMPAVALSRHPIDVVLVLDKSGSMGWGLPGGPAAPSRWTVLGTALDQFEALWEQSSETDVGGDRLGVVHFDGNATSTTFGASKFKRRDGTIPVGQTHAWEEVLAAAKAPSPGGSTAFGKGVNLAYNDWIADPASIDAAFVLMTDGQQNVPPLIEEIAATTDLALDNPSDAVPGPVELYKLGIPMQTIGFGIPAALDAQLLGGIASQTTGTSIVTATDAGLSVAMQDTLMQALKGNTMGLLLRTEGSVAPPAGPSVPHALMIDASVQRATFVLSWTGRRGLLDMSVFPPGSTTPAPFAVRKAGATWLIASVNLPAAGPIGEWTVVVRGNDLNAPATYRLSTYAVDKFLKYSLQFNRGRSGTGDDVRLAADVSNKGVPLKGIPGGIRISLDGPQEGLGNILHGSDATGDVVQGPDTMTPYDAKVMELAKGGGLAGTLPKPTGVQRVLADAGADGDEFAGDGVYSTSVGETRTPGRYRFNVVLEWDHPLTGKVRRLEVVERDVHVVADPSSTVVEILPPSPDGSYVLRVTPKDKFGNFMGPGYGNRVKITVNGGTATAVLDPNQKGVYTVRIAGIAPGTTATVTIVVDNVVVRTNMPVVPTSTGPGSKGNRAVWLAFGSTYPHGSFSNGFDRDLAVNGAFEYGLGSGWAVEGTIGRHEFEGKNGAPSLEAMQYGLNAKYYFAMPGWRPFITGGIGAYDFDPGSTQFGASLGVGAQVSLNPQWSIEGRYTYHAISGNSPNSRYSTLLLGLRFSF